MRLNQLDDVLFPGEERPVFVTIWDRSGERHLPAPGKKAIVNVASQRVLGIVGRGHGLVRVGEADKVVERDQAGVVVAMLETQRLADGVEQERLARAAPADEQHRVAGRERGENQGFLRIEAVGAEGGQAAAGW